tara:strand:- start:23 stop:250 length:228 start_codon:yes stop_codon:yes gene_type:complete
MRLFLLFAIILAAFGQLYVRVEPFMVSERVTQFLEDQHLDNCFERIVGENELHLKCLRDSALVDVRIYVMEELYV